MVTEAALGDDLVKASYLPTVLQRSARTWLMNLPKCIVQSWDHLRQLFEAKFHATYSHPNHEDDLFACVQKPDEHLQDFIHKFSEIRKTIPDMSEDQVIVAFKQGCKDERTMEKLATKNPKTVAELYKILNATTKVADAQAQCMDSPT